MTAVSTIGVGSAQIATPGAYSQVDASAAESGNISGGGRIAIVGTAPNGRPQYAQVFSTLASLRKAFWVLDTGGDLGIRMAAKIAHEAANDPLIQAKPESICVVKVNRDTQATGVLQGSTGALINLTSEDYGTHANKIRITVGAGTAGGVALTIREGSVIEIGDDIGKDPALTIEHTGEATTASVDIDATGIQINYTKTDAGENGGQVSAGWTGGTPRMQSGSTADNYQQVTLYGLNAGNEPISESKDLNGTTYVDFTTTFTKLTGAKINGLNVGLVTIEDGGDVIKVTFAATLLAATTPGTLRVVSASAADVGMIVQLTGENAAGETVVENLTLNGTTLVTGTTSFSKLLRVAITGTTAGPTTVSDSAASLITLAAAANPSQGFFNTKGLYLPQTLPSASEITVTGSAAYDLVVRGVDDTGAAVAERIVDGAGGAQVSAALFVSITQIELGVTATTTTLTYAGEMVDMLAAETLEDVVEFLNDTGAFDAVSYADDRLISEMDRVVATSCLSPAVASLYSRAVDVVEWINENSSLVTAERESGASGLPVLTTVPVAMSGATSPAATVADWQAAIDLLRDQEVDHVVCLTTDSAVRAYAATHVRWADGRKERALYCGMPANSTIAAIDAASMALNTRWASLYDDSWQTYDEAGVLRTYSPVAAAVAAAGMNASMPVGEPLTRKYVSALAVGNTNRSALDDSEQLLRKGLCFLAVVPNKGTRWVRSITTYRRSTNRVYTEQSASASLAWSVQDLRTFIDDTVIGGTTIRPPIESIRSDAVGRLVWQRDVAKKITAFADVTVAEVGGDVNVDYDCTPILPRNFAMITAHASTATPTE